MSKKKINSTKIEKQKNALPVRKPIFVFQTVKRKQVRSNEQWCTPFLTQQFSINKTCCGKLMPSSVVKARYNAISSNHI